MLHIIGHKARLYVVSRNVINTRYAHIPEPMIDKSGMPPASLALVSVADVYVFRLGITQIGHIQGAVGVEPLGIFNADGVSFVTPNPDIHPAGDILSAINENAIGSITCNIGKIIEDIRKDGI